MTLSCFMRGMPDHLIKPKLSTEWKMKYIRLTFIVYCFWPRWISSQVNGVKIALSYINWILVSEIDGNYVWHYTLFPNSLRVKKKKKVYSQYLINLHLLKSRTPLIFFFFFKVFVVIFSLIIGNNEIVPFWNSCTIARLSEWVNFNLK